MVRTMNLGTRAGFNTRAHLHNAEKQAKERGLDKILIVDADSHHYENEWMTDIFRYVEDPVLRQTFLSNPGGKGSALLYNAARNQFNAGRILRYTKDRMESPEPGEHLDATRARRQREAIGLDYQVVFPTPMLQLGLHPNPRVETALAWAYTRWWTEEVLPNDPGMRTMVYLPFRDPEASLRMIETFSESPGVIGFMVTSTRFVAVHEDKYMPIYAALEERGMPLGFHAGFNQQDRLLEGMNRFLSVHAIGFVLNNLIHTTNLVINGIPERFPNLKLIIIESGLAWIPFLMQRLDNEYLMRTNEAPLLKKRPSEYMAQNFYYTTQPLEMENMQALELTLEMINAETQLMFASDYPHWDFNLPSTIYDLPFLNREQKLNILGRNALEVFPILKRDYEASSIRAHRPSVPPRNGAGHH
ncbi:MAG: amidohydrolase family protein [Nitriliruptorales bacterium]|nr:amidohydrolase family protein [Nitriliruptorales bacterium]